MILYGLIILGFWWLSLILNAIFKLKVFLDALLWLVIGIVILVAIDAAVVLIFRFLPQKAAKKLYNPFAKFYQQKKWENNLYLKVGVRKWKDRIPELGKLGGFKKDKLQNLEASYIYRFLQDGCFSEVEHLVSAGASILILFIIPFKFFLTTSVIYFLCNVLLNIMPVIVQRYLRPKLLALYRRQRLKEDPNASEFQTPVAHETTPADVLYAQTPDSGAQLINDDQMISMEPVVDNYTTQPEEAVSPYTIDAQAPIEPTYVTNNVITEEPVVESQPVYEQPVMPEQPTYVQPEPVMQPQQPMYEQPVAPITSAEPSLEDRLEAARQYQQMMQLQSNQQVAQEVAANEPQPEPVMQPQQMYEQPVAPITPVAPVEPTEPNDPFNW